MKTRNSSWWSMAALGAIERGGVEWMVGDQ